MNNSENENEDEEITDLKILQEENKRIKKEMKFLQRQVTSDQNDELSLKLDITKLKFEINKFEIDLENATTEKKKEKLREQIETKEKLLDTYVQQLQQRQPHSDQIQELNQFKDLIIQDNPYLLISLGEESDKFINWPQPISIFNNIQKMMIRDSYIHIYDLIMENLNINITKHLVTGVPGIGKSNFSLYFIWRYLRENPGAHFLFESNYDSIYYLTPSRTQILCRNECIKFKVPYLVDFSAQSEPHTDIGSFTVVFCSPDPSRYKQMIRNLQFARRYILPVWSEEELSQLNNVVYHIDNTDISIRFLIIGGIPRYIFSQNESFLENAITSALAEKGEEIAEHFMEQGFGMRDEKVSYSLIHLYPDETNGYCTSGGKYKFATDYVWQRLYEKHHLRILAKSKDFFNGGSGAYGGSYPGYHFELMCLQAVPIARTVQTITPLTDNNNDHRHVVIPASQRVNFSFDNYTIEKHVLYIPTKRNFESGDAFYVNNSNELFVLQITVGETHPVKANGLDHIYKIVSERLGIMDLCCHLIFVVPAKGKLTKAQSITTQTGDEIKKQKDHIKMFQQNQWRLEYFLNIPNDETLQLQPAPTNRRRSRSF